MRSIRMQMNGGKLAMQPETDVGNELPMTSFDVTHPPRKSGYVLTTDFAPRRQRESERLVSKHDA